MLPTSKKVGTKNKSILTKKDFKIWTIREMKSRNLTPSTNSKTAIRDFWDWFRSNRERIAAHPQDAEVLQSLDRMLRRVENRLSWEIGPGSSKAWQLVISPNLDRRLRKVARSIVSHAPIVDDWEFHSARRPKVWNYSFEVDSTDGRKTLNASDWSFVLLQYPNGVHEVLLCGRHLPALSDDERSQAAAIVLESILGEDLMLDAIDEFDLVDELEPRFAVKARPIRQLRDAVLGPSNHEIPPSRPN